jgi:hypothetical protein
MIPSPQPAARWLWRRIRGVYCSINLFMLDKLIPSQTLRICFIIAVFATLAIADLIRRGRRATRWREYAFLLFCVIVAMIYGIANDQITSRISWEYFYYGKELGPVLGPQIPPDPTALHWQALRIGIEATWWVGLLTGAVILIANNPSARLPSLSYRRLMARLIPCIATAIVLAALFGAAGHKYWLNWVSSDFSEMADLNLWRPHHFLTAWGIHLGGYLGGAIGAVYAVWSVRRERNFLVRRRTEFSRHAPETKI